MTAPKLAARFRRLVSDARAEGVLVVADADAIAVRFVQTPVDRSDLRHLGESVYVDDACGGGAQTSRSQYGDG